MLSPASYNGKTKLMLCCPITSRIKGYPFEVRLPDDQAIRGVVLADQFRSLDWEALNAESASKTPLALTEAVLAMATALLR